MAGEGFCSFYFFRDYRSPQGWDFANLVFFASVWGRGELAFLRLVGDRSHDREADAEGGFSSESRICAS